MNSRVHHSKPEHVYISPHRIQGWQSPCYSKSFNVLKVPSLWLWVLPYDSRAESQTRILLCTQETKHTSITSFPEMRLFWIPTTKKPQFNSRQTDFQCSQNVMFCGGPERAKGCACFTLLCIRDHDVVCCSPLWTTCPVLDLSGWGSWPSWGCGATLSGRLCSRSISLRRNVTWLDIKAATINSLTN